MKKIISVALLLLAPNIFAEGGFYAGVGAGVSMLSNTPQNGLVFNNGSNSTQASSNIASTLYLGYDFNSYFGLQEEYNVAFNSPIVNSYSINQQLLNTSLVIHFPFALLSNSLTGLSVFAKGGIAYDVLGFSNVKATCTNCLQPPGASTGFVPTYGAGVEYGVSNVGLRAEWDYTSNLTASNLGINQIQSNSNSFLVSVLYHF